MKYKLISNEKGLSVEIVNHVSETENTFIQIGGDSSNPSWEEYLADFKEQYQDHVKLIKKSIEENGLIGYTGQDADGWYFKFSDGEIWGFSWRAWGDLMQAIIDKKEGYIAYYM